MLDALGLAGNLETARLLEQIGGGDTAAALETLACLYGAGKEMGSLLGELSALVRDLLVRKTAPKGGAALLTGGYDENTMRKLSNLFQTPRLVQMLSILQTTLADLSRSGNRRTDTELCLIRLCDPALDESLAGLNARLSRVEELLAGGVPATCAVPPAQQKRTQRPIQQQPEDLPPWEEERPPLPEEPGEPVGYEPEPPVQAAPPVQAPRSARPEASVQPAPERQASAPADLWPGLVTALRGKFPAVYPFLSNPSAVQGVLDAGTLTLWVDNPFTQNMVGTPAVLEALAKLAGAQTGGAVRCVVKVGAPPKQAPAVSNDGEQEHDNLEDLLALGQQFDNIIIQE